MPGRCFSGHEKFDLLWHGKKIAGAAQRRNRFGLLIQGSVQPPPLPLNRGDFEQAMGAVGRKHFKIAWADLTPEADLDGQARNLAARKYSQAAYNRKR